MKGFILNVAIKIRTSKFSRTFLDWGLWFLSSWIFDSILYPVVIGWLGPIVGGLIMASISITICWFWLNAIIISDKEWFNIDVMHKIKNIIFCVVRISEQISFIKKGWVDKVEFVLTLIIINIFFDPMIATLYFRHGNKAKVINEKDKKIFAWSAFVSNFYWTLRSWGIASVVIYVWNLFIK